MKKSDVFRHFILTRYNNGIYDREDAAEWMEKRFEVFQETKKSVLSQKEHFLWVIAFDPFTPEGEIEKIITDERMIAYLGDIRNLFTDPGIKGSVDTPWVITSRLDNDDQYRPGTIKAIQDAFEENERIIDIPYNQFYNNKRYPSLRTLPNSPFLSLIEKTNKPKIRTCYARPHNKMVEDWRRPGPKFVDIQLDEKGREIPLAYMVIHKENMMNKLLSKVKDNIK